jgi:hypothetical protein
MINLIPNEERKKMVRSFYYRLMIVFLIALSIAIFISTAALMPTYFLSSIKENLANDKVAELEREPVSLPDQETVSSIQELNKKINVVETSRKTQLKVSEVVISQIIQKKMPDIKIFQISYEDQGEVGKRIEIRGTAPSRERLLLFRLALESDPNFKQVDLPISNFVRGSNIQFYLSLIPS